MMMYGWNSWLENNLRTLRSGSKLRVPAWLPHPRTVGFKRLELAAPAGQVADWTLPLQDGSRVHIHEYKDGAMVAHCDKYDPEIGPAKAVAHFFTDTNLGKVTVAVAITSAIAALLYLFARRIGK